MLTLEMPTVEVPRPDLATARVYTHKGELLQGPIPVPGETGERYTMGVFSLLDNLNSAFVDVRLRRTTASLRPGDVPQPEPIVHPNGWNDGEVSLVRKAVVATWRAVTSRSTPAPGEPVELCSYHVYGYHDIRVGAGSGSSSALVQATILATAAEHGVSLSDDELSEIHSQVESGADPLHLRTPAVVATRLNLGRPVRSLGNRTPRFRAVVWSAGPPVRTDRVRFEYDDDLLLLWRVRWASVDRAVRSEDHARVAVLATESARENQGRNPNADIALLEQAVSDFGALGFAVAHTGTYHVALFAEATADAVITRYEEHVANHTTDGPVEPEHFDTADAAVRRSA